MFTKRSSTKMRRKSWPNCEQVLPLVFVESIETRMHHVERQITKKRRLNRSSKMISKVAGAMFVIYLGYVAGRSMVDKIGCYRYIDGLAFFKTVDEEANMVLQAEDVADDGNIQSNKLPIDHNSVMESDEYTVVKDNFPFIVPLLREYEMGPLLWKSNSKEVDQNTRLVSLPRSLTEEVEKFCVEIGLGGLFQWAVSSEDLDIGQSIITGPTNLKKGHQWAITRGGEHKDSSNLHWFHANDERSYEATVDVLKRGNFDHVLNTIASEFKPWGYMFAGMGFTVGSHSEASLIGRETPGAGKNLLKLVFPIHLPRNKVAKLYLGNDEEKKVAPLGLNYNQGLLLSGDSIFGTAEFDHRRDGNFQILASIYIADIHSHNVDMITDDNTALCSTLGNTDWLLAQRGRFWGGTDGGSFDSDAGRRPYHAKDELRNCLEMAERGLCLEPSDSKDDPGLWDVRKLCSKSCRIFIDDRTYFSDVRPHPRQPEVIEKTPAFVTLPYKKQTTQSRARHLRYYV